MNSNKSLIFAGLLYLFFLIGLSGCVMVPILNSVKKAGLTKQQRENIFPESVQDFQEARFWSDPQMTNKMIASKSLRQVKSALRKIPSSSRIVDSKLIDYFFDGDSSYHATAVVKMRYYSNSSLVVSELEEEQSWVFNMSDGWKLKSIGNGLIGDDIASKDAIRDGGLERTHNFSAPAL